MSLEAATHIADRPTCEHPARSSRAYRRQRPMQALGELAQALGRRASFRVSRRAMVMVIAETQTAVSARTLKMLVAHGWLDYGGCDAVGMWRYAISEAGRAILRSEAGSARA